MIKVKKMERTDTSIPFNAANRQLIPINLDLYNYVEEEYFYSGCANVYELKENQVQIKHKNAPYTNRFLLRKPKGRCSGKVVFEVLNSTNGWDVAPMWALLWKKIVQDGDVYVGMTSRSVSVRALKQYDASRYESLSWKNPNLNPGEISKDILMWQHSIPQDEDGLIWDIMNQLSTYLKTSLVTKELGVEVNRIYATGCSQSAMLLSTFMTRFDESTKESFIQSSFDGYLTYSGARELSLNQEQSPCPIEIVRNVRVPVMRFMSQWDFKDFAGDLRLRREDSDNINDRFRLYEVAGQAHNSYVGAFYRPGKEELARIGQETDLPKNNISPLPLEALICQGLRNLEVWTEKNIAPPCCQRIEVDKEGNELFDEYGNCKGGLRYPQLDVAYATYYSGTKENAQESYYVPFSCAKLKKIYKTRKNYIHQIFGKMEEMLQQRWISLSDLEHMEEDILKLDIFKEDDVNGYE